MKKTVSVALCAALMLTALPATLAEEAQALEPGDTIAVSDGGTHTYTGDVEVSGKETAVSVSGGSTVIIEDGDINVSGNEQSAVIVDGATLTVSGDVNADGDTLLAQGKTNVTVTGDVGSDEGDAVTAYSGSTVSVDGNVSSGDDGVVARPGTSLMQVLSPGATVIVGGDITSDEEGITAQNSTVIVEGSVSAGRDGVDAYRSCVYVTGDVEADRIGAGVLVNSMSSADNILFVEGTISGSEGALVIMDYTPMPFLIKNAGESNLPGVVVGKLESEGDLIRAVTVQEANLTTFEITKYTDNQDLTDKMIAKVSYIVLNDDSVTTDASETFTSIDGAEYKIAHEGDTIIVTPVAKKGYKVTGLKVGDYARYEENEDGSYTVTVMRGGDLVLSAVMKKIPATTNSKRTPAKAALWSIKETDANGNVWLISTKVFSEAELEDLQALLATQLSEEELALLAVDENGLPLISVENGQLVIVTAVENASVFTAKV